MNTVMNGRFSKAYFEPTRTSTMDFFKKIVNAVT